MFSLKQLVVLALAGLSIAAPAPHRRHPRPQQGTVQVDTDTPLGGREPGTQGWGGKQGDKYVVVVTTSDGDDATPVNPAPAKSTTPVVVSTGNTGSTGSAPVSSGSDTGYMGTVNKWRTAMGRPTFTQSSKLEGNARKTAADGNGKMVHQLNPGSMGQVLAPGNANNFESVFVGGWLCEVPSLPGLGQSVCGSMSKGWSHDGQTGHADILSSTKYTNIGCALAGGIWACDVS